MGRERSDRTVGRLEGEIEDLEDDIQVLERNVERLRTRLSRRDNSIRELEKKSTFYEQQHQMHQTELRQKGQLIATLRNDLHDLHQEMTTQCENKEKSVMQLTNELVEARKQLKQTQETPSIDHLTREIQQLRQERADKTRENEQLQETLSVLRDNVFKKVPPETVNTGAIERQYMALLEQILRITHDKQKILNELAVQPHSSAEQVRFHNSLVQWSENRTYVLRAEVYRLVHDRVLQSRVFGLAGHRFWNQTGTGDSMEIQLGKFEKLMQDRNVSPAVLSDWTVSTRDCILRAEIGQSEFESYLTAEARSACEHFKHILSATWANIEEEAMRAKFLTLFRHAYTLRVLMRTSGDSYTSRFLEPGTPLGPDAMCVAGNGSGVLSPTVALTVFGALVHRNAAGEELVLRQAEVIAGGWGLSNKDPIKIPRCI